MVNIIPADCYRNCFFAVRKRGIFGFDYPLWPNVCDILALTQKSPDETLCARALSSSRGRTVSASILLVISLLGFRFIYFYCVYVHTQPHAPPLTFQHPWLTACRIVWASSCSRRWLLDCVAPAEWTGKNVFLRKAELTQTVFIILSSKAAMSLCCFP